MSLLAALLLSQAPIIQPAAPTANAGGDQRIVRFDRPVAAALERAKHEQRLVFLKPVYGGVDQLGARSYCEGTW
jgi:hypothetical protein